MLQCRNLLIQDSIKTRKENYSSPACSEYMAYDIKLRKMVEAKNPKIVTKVTKRENKLTSLESTSQLSGNKVTNNNLY